MEDTLTVIEKTAFLKGTELFASIPTEVLAQLAARGRELHFDAGQTIFVEGEPHTFSAVATQHTHVLNVSNDVLFDTIIDYPEVGVGMVRALSKRVSELAQRVHDLEDEIAQPAAASGRTDDETRPA